MDSENIYNTFQTHSGLPKARRCNCLTSSFHVPSSPSTQSLKAHTNTQSCYTIPNGHTQLHNVDYNQQPPTPTPSQPLETAFEGTHQHPRPNHAHPRIHPRNHLPPGATILLLRAGPPRPPRPPGTPHLPHPAPTHANLPRLLDRAPPQP